MPMNEVRRAVYLKRHFKMCVVRFKHLAELRRNISIKPLEGIGNFPDKYSPENESHWYKHWKLSGYFKCNPEQVTNFVIVLPPPNITGTLHIGHALTVSVQDCLIRWQKMLGRNVSWIPSLDHAGIGTQIVVEKHLITKYKKKRYEIGKERFVEQIWEWKTEKEMEILRQLESLGCALDWDRLSFTLDKDFSDIVQEAFVFLFDKGFITRQPQIVNWCCDLKSAVSDLEVEHIHVSGVTEIKVPGHSNKIQFGQLYTVKYPLIDSLSGEVVLVSTTRPETILGDVALAIHPDDPRYSNLQGKRVMNPITKEIIPLVESSYVKQEFGTGVVKVTPGHDELDHRIATKLKLPTKLVMTDSGHITEGHGALSGLSRYDARKEVVALLLQNEMLHSIVDHPMSIPLCSRSGDVIEPMVKSLW